MGPRGEDLTRLTNDPASDNDPDWSPDGTQIAFVRNGDIFVMKADGSDHINLTNTLPPMVEEFPRGHPTEIRSRSTATGTIPSGPAST
jgi:Tol biopolymer transport system component